MIILPILLLLANNNANAMHLIADRTKSETP